MGHDNLERNETSSSNSKRTLWLPEMTKWVQVYIISSRTTKTLRPPTTINKKLQVLVHLPQNLISCPNGASGN